MTRTTFRPRSRAVPAIVSAAALVLLAAPSLARDPFGGPTVVLEPGDVTALRGPNIRNPLGPSSVYAPRPELPDPSGRALQQDLDRELRRLPSRTTARPEGSLPSLRLETDRARAAAALEAFRTMRPNDPSTPVLERQLDQIERPTWLGQ